MLLNLKIFIKTYLFIVCFLSILTTTIASAQETDDYILNSDDVVSVYVYDEPDLSLDNERVSNLGSITMPLVGTVVVKGLSVTQAEEKIEGLYKGDYLKNPDVRIVIDEYRQFFVNGEVKKPGAFSFRKGMTVQRAITLAGGFTERASKSDITLIEEGNKNITKEVSLNHSVKPGDVITVQESFF